MLSLFIKSLQRYSTFKTKCLNKFYKLISNGIYFEFILKIYLEGLVEISICAVMNIQTLSIDSLGEVMGSFYSVFSISLISVIMPTVLITLLVMVFYDDGTLKRK